MFKPNAWNIFYLYNNKNLIIGISFCECEASLSASFSSLGNEITCVEDILCEGRVEFNSFQEFKSKFYKI